MKKELYRSSKIFLLLVGFLIGASSMSFAQTDHEAPTLQLGLSGLTFDKGTLDAELIAEIIAEKQQEVKARLIQTMLLNNIKVDNSLFYTYIDDTIELMLTRSDEDIRIRNVLESTVNLAFTIGFAEFYLRSLAPEDPMRGNIRRIANTYNQKADTTYGKIPTTGQAFTSNQLSLTSFTSINFNGADVNTNYETLHNEFVSLLVDMAAMVVYENKTLEKFGLMRTNNFLKNSSKNAYLSYVNDQRAFGAGTVEDVKNDMATKLESYLRLAGFVQTALSKGFDNKKFKLDDLFSSLSDSTKGAFIYDQVINKLTSAIQVQGEKNIAISQDRINAVYQFIQNIKTVSKDNIESNLRVFENDIRPTLNELVSYSPEYLSIIDSIEAALYAIAAAHLESFEMQDHLILNLDSPFLLLLTNLWNLDKVETYSLFLNQIIDAGNVFSDPVMANSINKILSFVRSYISFPENQNKTYVSIDVEGFIVALQKLNYNKFRPLELHFTVGANNLSFNSNFAVSETQNLRNYAFVGEKVGLKLKIIDWKYLRSFEPGEIYTYWGRKYKRIAPAKEPTVSNLHLLFYGSGFLYSLANTGTTADFNDPVLGAGIGLTFFNNLDMNVSVGKPLTRDTNFFNTDIPHFFSIGFDIQFVEYLDRLGKKRRANKNQQKLTKALSASN